MMAVDSGMFKVLYADQEGDAEEWLAIWSSWPGREVFAHPNYVSLYSAGETSRAAAAVYADDSNVVLYPFLIRNLPSEQWWNSTEGHGADITTPYGYGGPFCWGDGDRDQTSERFWPAFDSWARAHGIIAEFVRMSLFKESLLPYPGEEEQRLVNVVRTLDGTADEIWMDFEHKVRKNVRKAERAGLTVEVDPDGARLHDFLRIYSHTMDRRGAASSYYFPEDFFEQIRKGLRGQFSFFHVFQGGSVVASELVLSSAENVYSFLGGTHSDAFDLRANDLLKYGVIKWALEQGKRRFVLGGGVQSDDGIFRFKLSFAPEGARPFYVGRRVLDPSSYERVLAHRLAGQEEPVGDAGSSFFPAYRDPRFR